MHIITVEFPNLPHSNPVGYGYPPSTGATSNKVTIIKAIRMLTGMGLKESKDIVDAGGKAELTVTNMINSEVEEAYRALRSQYVVVSTADKILTELRALATQALAMHEDELANEILQLVLAEKLRRDAYGR